MTNKNTRTLGEWDAFKKSLDSLLTEQIPEVLTIAATDAMIDLDQRARDTYPPPVRRLKQSQWWTDKQRRWWWATMADKADGKSNALPGWQAVRDADGKLQISGAYKRTGKLVQSLVYEVKANSRGVIARYGTNRRYARYVIGNKATEQARYHQGNWATLVDILDRALPKMTETFAATLMREIDKRLPG